MLRSIDYEGYRSFSHYSLAHLSRVNLLVGRNSCGKTSLLEGVQLLASGGDPGVLIDIARRRGEMAPAREHTDRYRQVSYPVLSHVFHGHDVSQGAHFRLVADRMRHGESIKVEVVRSQRQAGLFDDRDALPSMLTIRIKGGTHPLAEQGIPVTEQGLLAVSARRVMASMRADQESLASVQFIAPDSLEPRSMSDMWNRVIMEGREGEATEALRILEPGVSGVVFLSGQPPYSYAAQGGIVISLQGSKRRLPIGSLGDGMRRVLALSLGLMQCQRGVLLVDEIDTGLHYSIMADMWRLIVETALRLDVQVFASTHSLDCLKGLAWLCTSLPVLAREVTVQKIDPDRSEAVALDAERVVMAVERGLEMR